MGLHIYNIYMYLHAKFGTNSLSRDHLSSFRKSAYERAIVVQLRHSRSITHLELKNAGIAILKKVLKDAEVCYVFILLNNLPYFPAHFQNL